MILLSWSENINKNIKAYLENNMMTKEVKQLGEQKLKFATAMTAVGRKWPHPVFLRVDSRPVNAESIFQIYVTVRLWPYRVQHMAWI